MLFAAFRAVCIGLCGLLVGGCLSVSNVINYAAADAMSYSRLAADARKDDPELAVAIKRISASAEHQRMQRVLADLPSDMRTCLVIEIAETGEAKELSPAIMCMFVSADSVGFLSNFAFDANGANAPRKGEWRAAVWPAPADAGSLLPDDPASLLNSSDTQEKSESKTAAIILTLVTDEQTLTLALWDDGSALAAPDGLVHNLLGRLPAGMRRSMAPGDL